MIEYLRVFARGWRYLAVAVILGGIAGAAVYALLPQRYESETTLYLSAPPTPGDVGAAYDGSQFAAQKATFLLPLLDGPEFASALAARLGTDDVSTMDDAVTAGVEPETPVVRITTSGATPEQAEQLASAASAVAADMIGRLEMSQQAQPTLVVQVAGEPSPGAPVSPGPALVAGLGLLLGLVVGCVLALVRDAFDRSVRDEEELGHLVGRPVLATIARDPRYARRPLIAGDEIDTGRAEAYRALRSALGFLPGRDAGTVLAVVGPVPGEGRTSVLCNLAVAVARSGRSVLVVGSDLRSPGVDALLGLGAGTGLTTVLGSHTTPFSAVRRWSTGPYDCLPTGPLPSNPSELLGSPRMAEVVAILRSHYDVVLLDTPPLLSVTDAVVTAVHADGAVFVAARGRSTRTDVERAVTTLRGSATPIAGCVLSGAEAPGLGPVVAAEQRIDDPTAVLPVTDRRPLPAASLGRIQDDTILPVAVSRHDPVDAPGTP